LTISSPEPTFKSGATVRGDFAQEFTAKTDERFAHAQDSIILDTG